MNNEYPDGARKQGVNLEKGLIGPETSESEEDSDDDGMGQYDGEQIKVTSKKQGEKLTDLIGKRGYDEDQLTQSGEGPLEIIEKKYKGEGRMDEED